MKWPIVEQTPAPEAKVDSHGEGSAVPVGVNRAAGEGGCYAKIVYQDANRPWRYAFIQNVRTFDSGAGGNPGNASGQPANVTAHGEVIFLDCDPSVQGPPGERSLWLDNDTHGPNIQYCDVSHQVKAVPGGEVLNWAEEVNHYPSVPLGTIVWLRGGETGVDADHNAPRHDYTFHYVTPDACTFSIQDSGTSDGNYTFVADYRGDPNLKMDGDITLNADNANQLDVNVTGEYLLAIHLQALSATAELGGTGDLAIQGFGFNFVLTPFPSLAIFGLESGTPLGPGTTILPATGSLSAVAHMNQGDTFSVILFVSTGTIQSLNGYLTLIRLKGVNYQVP